MASRLAIFYLDTLTTRTVLIDPGVVEAPNWITDNSALIVNKGGHLFRVPLAAPALVHIDTGFAAELNNDHGISPDGRTLAISDKSENGLSCIYTLPIGGGHPLRITEHTPSYWYGWSPDGRTMTYTAQRGATFDIHVISTNGGQETCLTFDFQHTDGPDFTPDGRWLWFNGERNDAMNLWRIRPDGSDLEQMTDTAARDWFPHPCPTAPVILYLAYRPAVREHSRDLPVQLRLLNPETGEDRPLYFMIGGQRTINTPCWAPDGRRFAFVETVELPENRE